MDGRNENKLPGLLFLGMWWMIDANTPYGDSAFLLALALLLIAWLSIRFFSVARTRLGEHAWAVLAQAVALAIAIFLIYPGPATMVLFWVWALGPFLIFAAAALRIALHGQGFNEALVTGHPLPIFIGMVGLFGLIAVWNDAYFLSGMTWGVGAALAGAIGWQFGAASNTRGRFDARMGDADSFDKAGMSRDR